MPTIAYVPYIHIQYGIFLMTGHTTFGYGYNTYVKEDLIDVRSTQLIEWGPCCSIGASAFRHVAEIRYFGGKAPV